MEVVYNIHSMIIVFTIKSRHQLIFRISEFDYSTIIDYTN